MNNSIEIICPLYNAEEYLLDLDKSFKSQKDVNLSKISYVYTESKDNTENLLKQLDANYKTLRKSEFFHSTAREDAVRESSDNIDIVVFVTQDVVIKDELWLKKLTEPIVSGKAEAAYSRQVTKFDNIEKYTREKNYPEKSSIVSKDDIEALGLRTFFFSDAASAIKREIFISLNGYDHKRLPISEDMYFAYKLITNGYKIAYCADSVVIHSHNFTLKEVYDRYKLTGTFFKQNKYLDEYGTNKSGGGLAFYILKRALQEKNIKVLIRFPFDMGARFIGMKVGKLKRGENNES